MFLPEIACWYLSIKIILFLCFSVSMCIWKKCPFYVLLFHLYEIPRVEILLENYFKSCKMASC